VIPEQHHESRRGIGLHIGEPAVRGAFAGLTEKRLARFPLGGGSLADDPGKLWVGRTEREKGHSELLVWGMKVNYPHKLLIPKKERGTGPLSKPVTTPVAQVKTSRDYLFQNLQILRMASMRRSFPTN
jgi:hypothetical protein